MAHGVVGARKCSVFGIQTTPRTRSTDLIFMEQANRMGCLNNSSYESQPRREKVLHLNRKLEKITDIYGVAYTWTGMQINKSCNEECLTLLLDLLLQFDRSFGQSLRQILCDKQTPASEPQLQQQCRQNGLKSEQS